MNIFIDAGCHDGDTVRSFCNYEPMMRWNFDTIIAFDFSPRFEKEWATIKREFPKKDVHFKQEALWTDNGHIRATLMPEGREHGNTAMSQKDKWGKGEWIEVKSIDFSQWLKRYKNDTVVIKMDIEGAEFPIMEKMIADGTDSIPELMLVEFHWAKMKGQSEKTKDYLIKRFKGPVAEWR